MNSYVNSKYNTTPSAAAMPKQIIGLNFVTNPGPWWVPVGLEETQGPGAKPPAYRPLFFGAEREWKNDEEGWQTYESRKQRQNRRRQNRRRTMETYDFNDAY